LNLHRETLIEQKVKAVFLLTMREASNLPSYAPDFWAFRHRVLEFGSPHAPNQKQPPVGLMLWHIENSITPIIDTKGKISSLTKMLTELPDQEEAVSLRIDLFYELGFLYWRSGDHLSAEKSLTSGINLAREYKVFDLLVKLQNGLAIIRYEQKSYQSATELLEPLIKNNPHDCLLLLNQAVVLFAMKKRYNGITKGKKATSLCTQNPWVWNSLGFLYYFAGNMDEAATCLQKAIEISPKSGYFYESLAVCYLAIGLDDKATAQLHQSKNNLGDREIYQTVLKEYIKGNTEKVSSLVESAVDVGTLSELDTTRDPILNTLSISI
jgi:tetratricopeptide (TPR) repeat protein